MKTNVVLVNFNSSSVTIEMMDSISNQLAYIQEIVIVDNNSEKSDIANIERYLRAQKHLASITTFEKNSKNMGYFPGLNIGLKKIKDTSNNFTIVSNNDLIFSDNFFKTLSNKEYSAHSMAIAPSVITTDGYYQNPSLEKPPSSKRVLMYDLFYTNYFIAYFLLKIRALLKLGKKSKRAKDNEEKNIFIGIGAIYILTPSFFKVHNLLDYDLFLYGEEAFLSRQIFKSGGGVLYDPSIEVVHNESYSTSRLPSKEKYKLTQLSYKHYRRFYIES